MLLLVLVLGTPLLVVLVRLVRCVRSDGLGHRPPPSVRPRGEDGWSW